MSYKAWPGPLAGALAELPADDPRHVAAARLAAVSDFAVEVLAQQPELLASLDEPLSPLQLPEDREPEWPALLRRWRRAQSLKLVWRDVAGLDTVEQTLAGSSWIAEQALGTGFDALLNAMRRVHGTVRGEDGNEQHMVVLGLGKLGGGELNFSSDVDLVYAFTDHGHSDGERPLPAETYFTRLGQRLANLLDEVTADGFCHRVDLRLRPFGASGRLLLSFNGMEQYFQSAGRDWERYAWLKARPVAGDVVAGERLLALLRPFVFRRYLDFTAIDGLREMKAKIAAEVRRREIADDLKLGRGGIREIEFYVQALQIIYGGRNPALQRKGLLDSLTALTEARLLPVEDAARLRAAYLFLRRLENRVQMLRDAQVHSLPDDPDSRARIAAGLGYENASALSAELDAQRDAVERLFAGLLGDPDGTDDGGDIPSSSAADLAALGYADAARHAERLQALLDAAADAMADRSRQRLQRVTGAFVRACAAAADPDACLGHALAFLQATLKRSSYIALIDEQPSSLQRMVQVFERSPWMARRMIEHPMLLDELLDARVIGRRLEADALPGQVASVLAAHAGDAETAMLALNEFKLSTGFRIAYHFLFLELGAVAASRLLTRLAECVLDACNRVAAEELRRQHGGIPGAAFAMVGYGSLGAASLAFNSDLDLVFLNRCQGAVASDGARPLDAGRFFMRQAQKLIALLGLNTPAGSLYEVDIRLRPDGAKGLLVSTLDSFAQYQRERAWVWELQALVRARAVAGDAGLCAGFEALRRELLCRPRAAGDLRAEIIAMRRRMRAELDRSGDGRIDLKHGRGAQTDIEFFLQYAVLAHAAAHPALADARDSLDILQALAQTGLLPQADADALAEAVERLQHVGLCCHLAERARVVEADAALSALCARTARILASRGLDFD